MKKIGLLLCFLLVAGAGLAQDAQWYANKGYENYEAGNYSQAIVYYKKLIELEGVNYPACCFNIGQCYHSLHDYTQAAYWYRKAAEQGHVNAQFSLGAFYGNGMGVKQDYEQAFYWYRKAAEQGQVEAQYIVGACYIDGLGVKEDQAQAFYWYRKAAEQGLGNAQGMLSLCYYEGIGTAQDLVQAKNWALKAIAQKDTDPHITTMVTATVLK